MSNETTEYDRNAALANLTPEELAAINDDDLTPEEKAALEDIAGDDDADDDSDDSDEDDEGEDPEPATKADGKPTPSAPATEAKAADDDAQDDEFRSRYQASLPTDFNDRLAALDANELEVANKFKAGDIEDEEFQANNKRIAAERAALDRAAVKAEIAHEMSAQIAEQEWEWTVRKFTREVKKAEGIDYAADKTRGADFDNFVRVLAANPANNDKDMEWFLSEAHKRTKVLHGVAEKSPKPSGDTPAKTKTTTRKPNLTAIPATLANVPGGDGPGDVTDEFASIDGLDGFAYEQALAKMSPAQRERYLAAA